MDAENNANISFDCGTAYTEDVEVFGFWFDGVLLTLIGIVGLISNVLALFVLSRPKLRDVFHHLLFALACFDIMYILCGGVNYTFRAFRAQSDIYTVLFPYLLHPCTHIAMSGTIFMTVAISIERYLGLCHPMLPPHARKAWFYILPVIFASLALNAPKFMEVTLSFEDGLPSYGHSELRIQESYIRYYIMWTRLFSTALIPVILLLFLNTRIVMDLFLTQVKRFGSVKRQKKEYNLCFILLCIVLIFFLCHTPRIVLDVLEFSHVEQVIGCPRLRRQLWMPAYWAQVLFYISHMMMMVNSSFNFVIYCLVGHTFRRELCRTLGLKHYTPVPGQCSQQQTGVILRRNSANNNGSNYLPPGAKTTTEEDIK